MSGSYASLKRRIADASAIAVFVVLIAVLGVLGLSDMRGAPAPEPGDLRAAGKVDFPVSC